MFANEQSCISYSCYAWEGLTSIPKQTKNFILFLGVTLLYPQLLSRLSNEEEQKGREWSVWQQVWHIWASDTYSYGIPIQYSTKCEIWKSWLSPANCGSGLALLLFFNPHKRRRIQCNSQLPKLFLYYQQRRFESWNVLDSSTLWEWGVDCTLWLPVINCYSFRSNCLTEPELCFVLSADFQDFGWAQQGDGSHFQGTDLAPDSDFRETWGCPEYSFKPEPFFLAWTKTQKPIPLSSVCKTERGEQNCVFLITFSNFEISTGVPF